MLVVALLLYLLINEIISILLLVLLLISFISIYDWPFKKKGKR